MQGLSMVYVQTIISWAGKENQARSIQTRSGPKNWKIKTPTPEISCPFYKPYISTSTWFISLYGHFKILKDPQSYRSTRTDHMITCVYCQSAEYKPAGISSKLGNFTNRSLPAKYHNTQGCVHASTWMGNVAHYITENVKPGSTCFFPEPPVFKQIKAWRCYVES